MITIVTITAEQTHRLRQQLLRPQQTLADMDFPGDHDSTTKHFGAEDENKTLVGIVSVFKNSHPIETNAQWQLRFMATTESVRGLGVGKKLVQAVESYCRSCKQSATPNQLWANARLHALGFYRACGFQEYGDIFELPEIGPHQLIIKSLK